MATVYGWKVKRMDYILSHESGNSNVVNVVSCWYMARSDANTVVQTEVNFTLNTDSLSSFVAWNDLTEETVLGWVTPTLTTEEISSLQAGLNHRISEIETPIQASGLPWEYEPLPFELEI